MVGPGRGSAAGSIVAYSLGITTVDPIKYGLIFERFLNPERVSMPDIDIKFFRFKLHPVGIVNLFFHLNTHQNILILCVLFFQIVYIVCRNKSDTRFLRQSQHIRNYSLLFAESVVLNFKEIIILTQNLRIF